jgi:hypothetical protein
VLQDDYGVIVEDAGRRELIRALGPRSPEVLRFYLRVAAFDLDPSGRLSPLALLANPSAANQFAAELIELLGSERVGVHWPSSGDPAAEKRALRSLRRRLER